MAINLNPGADPTLVNAAYRAAMANVPKDLSGTFEAMAKNYAVTMQTLGAVWGGVAKNIAGVAKEAIDRAVEVKNYEARGLKYQNKDGVSFLTDSLDNIKNELYGTWTGDPFSRESRAERIRLRQKRDKIFGQIDMLDAGVSSLGDVLTSGQFDEQATGLNNMRFVNAAQAFSTSSGKTKEGDYLVPSYDENDDITLTLYDKTGKAVAKDDGSFITHKPNEIDGLLVRDNPQLLGSGNKLFENLETQGYKYGGEYSFAGKKFRRGMGELVKNGNNLHNAMNKDFYHLDRSFMDDLTSPDGSVTSASIFGMLNNKLPVDSEGNPLPITDSNDSGGIDAGDFASEENMLLLQTALTDKTSKYYDEDVTRDVFLDWAEMQGEAAFNYGKGRRVPKGDGSGSGAKGKPYQQAGWGAYQFNTGGSKTDSPTSITWVDAERRRTALDNFETVSGEHGNYTWDGKMYIDQDDNKYTIADVARIEGLIKPGEKIADFRVEKIELKKEEDEAKGEGKAYLSQIKNTTNDDNAATALNTHFGLEGLNEEFAFAPYASGVFKMKGDKYGTGFGKADDPDTDDIMLYNPLTQEPYLATQEDVNAGLAKNVGDIARFNTQNEATQEQINRINEILKDYLKFQQPVNTDFATTPEE
tara:strand:- start:10 stop:1935 length:1926 start_codon:yes stop_codon:yes gene_type:complete